MNPPSNRNPNGKASWTGLGPARWITVPARLLVSAIARKILFEFAQAGRSARLADYAPLSERETEIISLLCPHSLRRVRPGRWCWEPACLEISRIPAYPVGVGCHTSSWRRWVSLNASGR